MSTLDLQVVWPLHRSHYLSPALADAGIDMATEPESAEGTTTPARELAVRALLAGGCVQQRVADLLDTSRRSVGRMVEADVTAALREADLVAQARRYLEQSVSRGVTPKERDAALAWLQDAVSDEQATDEPVESAPAPLATPATASDLQEPPRRSEPVRGRPVRVQHTKRTRTGATPRPPHVSPTRVPPHAAVALDQVDELTRQQQRILHRSTLIDYVLAAEKQGGQPLTLGDALAELLADITEAARTIGTILLQVGDRRKA